MKLIYIKPSKSKNYLTLGFTDGENKYSYTISELDYAELGSPLIGYLADERIISDIRKSDERYRATLCALRILSYGDNSKRNLYSKLISRSYSREVAEEVVCEMVGRGYINEENQLLRLVEREANSSLSGPRKISNKLMAKGFSRADIETAIDALVRSGNIDFEASKKALIEKKLARDATFDEKKALLYKYGY